MKTHKVIAGLGALLLLVVGGLVYQGDVSASSLSTNITIQVSSTLSGTVGLANASAPVTLSQVTQLANGAGAGQADRVYTSHATIASGGTLSLDLQGSLTDALGQAFTPAKVRAVYIFSNGGNTTNLTLFGDANGVPILNTPATTATLQPGGTFLVTAPPLAGIAVTASTGDIVKLVNAAGAAAIVDIIIVGTSV
jgi:hypothetical protein